MTGKKVALIAVPILAVAVIAAVIFTYPFQFPAGPALAGANKTAGQSGGEITQAETNAEPKCDAVTNRVTAGVVYIDGYGTNETRKQAARLLVDEYCKRPPLVREISVMASPGNGLVAYACDTGSGKAGDAALQDSLRAYGSIYCESAFVMIFEDAEFMKESVNNYREELLQEQEQDSGDPEANSNRTATVNMEEIEPKIQEIIEVTNHAQGLLRSGDYYESAKSLDGASRLLEQLD